MSIPKFEVNATHYATHYLYVVVVVAAAAAEPNNRHATQVFPQDIDTDTMKSAVKHQ